MSPAEHLEWLADDVAWFERRAAPNLDVAVPTCPGWDVADVMTHLALGLGLAYPHAIETPPDGDDAQAFAAVPWPATPPVGAAVAEAFSAHMATCLATFRRTDPATPCWTYAGPGLAAFWFRRAAVEMTVHRMDVAAALDEPFELYVTRAVDAVAETCEFALPLAAELVGAPPGGLRVSPAEGPPHVLGADGPAGELAGPAVAVLARLWGRDDGRAVARGGADAWCDLVAAAFAGR